MEENQRLLHTLNGLIACRPPEKQADDTTIRSGFMVVAKKAQLVELQVVCPTYATLMARPGHLAVSKGNRIFVRADSMAHDWAKTVHEVDGLKFILVPESFVVAVDLK